jgi:hypothetical protein
VIVQVVRYQVGLQWITNHARVKATLQAVIIITAAVTTVLLIAAAVITMPSARPAFQRKLSSRNSAKMHV